MTERLDKIAAMLVEAKECTAAADELDLALFFHKVASSIDGANPDSFLDSVATQQKNEIPDFSDLDFDGNKVLEMLTEITGDPDEAQAIMLAAAEDGVTSEMGDQHPDDASVADTVQQIADNPHLDD